MEVFNLSLLNWLDHLFWDELRAVRNACKVFGGVHDERGARAK